MSWTARLPTLKGFSYFLYVATNWGTLSREIDDYRKQIHDREEWMKQHAEHHATEKERLQQEAAEWAERAVGAATKAEEAVTELERTNKIVQEMWRELFDSTWLLAVMLSTEAFPTRESLLATLSPILQTLVRGHMDKLPPSPFARRSSPFTRPPFLPLAPPQMAPYIPAAPSKVPRPEVPSLPPKQNFRSEREDDKQ